MKTIYFNWLNNKGKWLETDDDTGKNISMDEIPVVLLLPYTDGESKGIKYITWCEKHKKYEYVTTIDDNDEFPHEFLTTAGCKISGFGLTIENWRSVNDIRKECNCRWIVRNRGKGQLYITAEVVRCDFYKNRFVVFEQERISKGYINRYIVGISLDLMNNKISYSPVRHNNSDIENEFCIKNMPEEVVECIIRELSVARNDIYGEMPFPECKEKGFIKVKAFMARPFDPCIYYLQEFFGKEDYNTYFPRSLRETFDVLCNYFEIEPKSYLKKAYNMNPYTLLDYILIRDIGFKNDSAIEKMLTYFGGFIEKWRTLVWWKINRDCLKDSGINKKLITLNRVREAWGFDKIDALRWLRSFFRKNRGFSDDEVAEYIINNFSLTDENIEALYLFGAFQKFFSEEQIKEFIKLGVNEQGREYLHGEITSLELPHTKIEYTLKELNYECCCGGISLYLIKYIDQVRVLQNMFKVSIKDVGTILNKLLNKEGVLVLVIGNDGNHETGKMAFWVKNGRVVFSPIKGKDYFHGIEKVLFAACADAKNFNVSALEVHGNYREIIERIHVRENNVITQEEIDALLNGGGIELCDFDCRDVPTVTENAEVHQVKGKNNFGKNDWYYLQNLPDREVYAGFYSDMAEVLKNEFLGRRRVYWGSEINDERTYLKYMVPRGRRIIEAAFNGICEAQNQIGTWYHKGDYVQKDLAHAMYWFKLAGKDCTEALINLAECCLELKLKSAAIELYQQAAEKGNKEAFRRLRQYDRGI